MTSTPEQPTAWSASAGVLTPARRATLDALCRLVVPVAYEEGAAACPDLAARVEARLAGGDPTLVRQVALLLAVLEHPLTGLLTTGRPRHFTRLDGDRQDVVFRGWGESRVGARRTIHQALRRLVLSTYYASPAAQQAIGYLGPYHARTPVFPWEGPLPGTTSDGEPVARAGDPPS